MKSLLLILFIALSSVASFSQAELQWMKLLGGNANSTDRSSQLQVDSEGNMYVTGFFQHEMDADPSEDEYILTSLAATNGGNAFLLKFNNAGELVWADAFTSTSSSWGNCLILDEEENPIVAGNFSSSIDADPTAGTQTLNSLGNSDCFIAKYDKMNGNLLWVFSYGNNVMDTPSTMKSDGQGHFLVFGALNLTVDFDGSEEVANLTSEGDYQNVYFAMYDTDGNFMWVKNITNSNPGFETFYWTDAISFDQDHNIIVAGNFFETADFDPSENSYELTAEGVHGAFIAKYSSSGEFIFARALISDEETGCHAVITDADNNIYAAGHFEGAVHLDGESNNIFTAGDDIQDIFFVKLDASGNFLWAKELAGETGSHSYARSISMDSENHVYLGCMYRYFEIDVDPGSAEVILDGNNNDNFFIGVYDSNGNFLDVSDIRGTVPYTYINVCDLDVIGDNVYVTGFHDASVDFDCTDGEFILTATSDEDFFFGVYTVPDLTSIVIEKEKENALVVVPNPSCDFISLLQKSFTASPGTMVRIYSSDGKKVLEHPYSSQIDIRSLAEGLYTIELNGVCSKLLKQ